MQITEIRLDGNLKEEIYFQNPMLHYSMYAVDFDNYFRRDIPWHWHDEFEFGYIESGHIIYRTNHQEMEFHAGDGVFFNAGVLHSLQPLDPVEDVRLRTQFFDRSFLAGADGSLFDVKYVAPVREQKGLMAVPLYQNDPESARVLEILKQGIDWSVKEEPFFEIRLRSLFSGLWETVYRWAEQERDREMTGKGGFFQDERIKEMMLYIEEHYSQRMTVAEVAAQVHVSERECYRLFQGSIGMTPVEFMNVYRLQKAQAMLLYTDKSILEIAVECGFGTSSYFGKLFRQYHQTTPKKYRQEWK